MERITLKNIKYSEWNSEETNCFQGVIYFDNKRVGFCNNDGRGGNTFCRPYDYEKDREKFKELEEYCKSLPPIKYDGLNELPNFEMESDLESVVDYLFEQWLLEKSSKKLIKEFENGIVYGSLRGYQVVQFKIGGKNRKLKDVLQTPQGVKYVKDFCVDLKSKNQTILNTNLPFEV